MKATKDKIQIRLHVQFKDNRWRFAVSRMFLGTGKRMRTAWHCNVRVAFLAAAWQQFHIPMKEVR